MHPSRILRQSSGDSFSSRYWHNQSGRNKFIIATTAIIAATTLAYYWGYQDLDKRHNPERAAASANSGEKRR